MHRSSELSVEMLRRFPLAFGWHRRRCTETGAARLKGRGGAGCSPNQREPQERKHRGSGPIGPTQGRSSMPRPAGGSAFQDITCCPSANRSMARRRVVMEGRPGPPESSSRCRNQPCRPRISVVVTMKRQSRPLTRRPAAIGSIRASQRARWVGAEHGPHGRAPDAAPALTKRKRSARSWW